MKPLPDKQPKRPQFSVRARAQSFSYAWTGLLVLVRTQHNARIHVLAGAAAIGLGWWLELDSVRMSLIVISAALVLAAEAVNTAIEMLMNEITSQRSWVGKWTKDLAAAAVLILSLAALAVGLLILGPPLYQRLIELL